VPSPQQQSSALPVRIQVDWRRIGKAARRVAILAAAIPLTAGAAVMVTDKIRGQRYPLDKKFPTAAPM
jgi:cardiolipin synthase A/B